MLLINGGIEPEKEVSFLLNPNGWDEVLDANDMRPVVLCKDCKYYQSDCGWCGLLDIEMNINGFCSRGVKREES